MGLNGKRFGGTEKDVHINQSNAGSNPASSAMIRITLIIASLPVILAIVVVCAIPTI